jgi:tRNA-Thr(GGU) m(6)t(6)A37 methyltransferase TsaA
MSEHKNKISISTEQEMLYAFFSTDAKKIIGITKDYEFSYFDFNRKNLLDKQYFKEITNIVAISKNASYFFVENSLKTLTYYEFKNNNLKEISSFNLPITKENLITISNKESLIIFIKDKELNFFDTITKTILRSISLKEQVFSLTLNSDNTQIALGLKNSIEILELTSYEISNKIPLEEDGIFNLSFLNHNKNLAYSNKDNNIKILALETNTVIRTFTGHLDKVLHLTSNPQDTYLISTSLDNTIKLWDIKFLSIDKKSVNEKNSGKYFINSKKEINTEEILLSPIGYVSCKQKDRYEAPRQATHAKNTKGFIELKKYHNFEQAVRDLEGFERIWLIYYFHINDGWKPLISPPRFHEKKVGVFSSRSPFRPNPIGLSCVKLERVDNLKIYISELDLLDGTPIIDIKPYIPYADAFPEAKTGWLIPKDIEYKIIFSKEATLQANILNHKDNVNIQNYTKVQLQFEPDNDTRKRIIKTKEVIDNKDVFILKFRQSEIFYTIDKETWIVFVIEVK